MGEEHGQPIEELLRAKTLLLTGASGFVGKAVLATCLSRLDGLREVRLLLRAADDAGAERRLREDVVPSLVFAPGEETDVEEALLSGRLRAESADLAAEGLGRTTPLDLSDVDVVVHCAA